MRVRQKASPLHAFQVLTQGFAVWGIPAEALTTARHHARQETFGLSPTVDLDDGSRRTTAYSGICWGVDFRSRSLRKVLGREPPHVGIRLFLLAGDEPKVERLRTAAAEDFAEAQICPDSAEKVKPHLCAMVCFPAASDGRCPYMTSKPPARGSERPANPPAPMHVGRFYCSLAGSGDGNCALAGANPRATRALSTHCA